MHHHHGSVGPRDGRAHRHERGTSLVEYALLLALIAFVCISALTYFGVSSKNSVNHSKDCVISAGTTDYATVCQ
jgi:Flp pilus assembly pilin Flp